MKNMAKMYRNDEENNNNEITKHLLKYTYTSIKSHRYFTRLYTYTRKTLDIKEILFYTYKNIEILYMTFEHIHVIVMLLKVVLLVKEKLYCI